MLGRSGSTHSGFVCLSGQAHICFTMVLLIQAWIGVLFLISGKICGLNMPLPPELPEWLFYGFIGGIVICAFQLCLSLVIRSFAVPVGIALIGGILGLVAMAKGYGYGSQLKTYVVL